MRNYTQSSYSWYSVCQSSPDDFLAISLPIETLALRADLGQHQELPGAVTGQALAVGVEGGHLAGLAGHAGEAVAGGPANLQRGEKLIMFASLVRIS